MATRKRARSAPTEDWPQLQLQFRWPEQAIYELIRPVVLFGRPATERARETGTPARTIYRQAERFDEHGMASLFAAPSTAQRADDRRLLPPPLRQLIVDLQAEHPSFHPNEIATICYVQYGRRPSPHTVQRVLAEGPPPSRTERRYPGYDNESFVIQPPVACIYDGVKPC